MSVERERDREPQTAAHEWITQAGLILTQQLLPVLN